MFTLHRLCLSLTKRWKYDAVLPDVQPVIILNLIDLHRIQLGPDSPQIVYRYRYPGSDWILVVQTQLCYISYSSPFIHCVFRLLLGKICKAVEFDPSQNKLRCTVLAVLSSRAIQQLGEAMLC